MAQIRINNLLINLFNNKVPSPQVEITYAEVNTLHSHIGDDALQPLCELGFYIIINSYHILSFICGNHRVAVDSSTLYYKNSNNDTKIIIFSKNSAL